MIRGLTAPSRRILGYIIAAEYEASTSTEFCPSHRSPFFIILTLGQLFLRYFIKSINSYLFSSSVQTHDFNLAKWDNPLISIVQLRGNYIPSCSSRRLCVCVVTYLAETCSTSLPSDLLFFDRPPAVIKKKKKMSSLYRPHDVAHKSGIYTEIA